MAGAGDSRPWRGRHPGWKGIEGVTKKLLLALLSVSAADAAVAQTTATRPPVVGTIPRPEGEGALGALGGVVRRIGVRVGVDASYESNVFGVSEAVARARGGNQALDDFQISPSLQLDLQVPFGRQSAYLRGSLGYDFLLRNKQLNRERIALDGGANLSLSGCSVTPNASYARSRSNAGDIFAIIPDPALVPDPFRIRNNVQTSYSYGAQVQCGGAIGLSPTFGYRHSELRNSAPLLKFNDSNQDAFDASIGYQRPSLGRISVFGSYSRGEFIARDIFFRRRGDPSFNGNALDGVENYSAGIRFERDIGSRAYGSISAGYSWANPNSPFSQRFRGSTYDLSLSLRPSNKLAVDLAVSRSANVANAVFASFAVTELYSLNASYRVNDRLGVSFGSSLQKRDFRQSGVTNDFARALSDDEFIRAYGAVNYDLNRRLRLNALVSQQRRKAADPAFGFNNTTVSVGASLALGPLTGTR